MNLIFKILGNVRVSFFRLKDNFFQNYNSFKVKQTIINTVYIYSYLLGENIDTF